MIKNIALLLKYSKQKKKKNYYSITFNRNNIVNA